MYVFIISSWASLISRPGNVRRPRDLERGMSTDVVHCHGEHFPVWWLFNELKRKFHRQK